MNVRDKIEYLPHDPGVYLMKDIRVLDKPVDIPPSKVDINTARKTVYAYAGEPITIKLRCKNSAVGSVVDQFGSGVRIEPLDDEYFIARVRTVPDGLLYWTMQYLADVEILEPENVRNRAIAMVKANPYGV